MPKRNYYKKVHSTRKARNKKLLIAALVILGLYRLTLDIFGDMGLIKYSRMESNKAALTTDIAALKKDNTKLTREIQGLKSSLDYIEIIARDKLGLARPGEIVYYYGEP